MANGMFNIGKQGLIDGTIDMDTDTIRARLVKNTYTFANTDTSMTPVTIVAGTTDQALAGRTVANGVFDANDVTFASVPSGDTVTGVVIFKFGTNDADSVPIAYLELVDTPANGGDIVVNFDTGPNKIFALNG